ncbi:MAG: NIPSNAP family protein [Chloroflexi bacterium]|nr:NIPSNAP family protein [Chloroflexota bacterium]|tara:strand:- start:25814 stop:26140 length:327 start_codon:yes stop_codon:yes gene_type:complete
MIYELRIYECFAGKLENLNERFRNHTLKLFEKHGIKNIGYWVGDVGPSNNTLTYLLAYPSHDARVKSWKDFRDDPVWHKVVEDSHKDGIIVKNVENQLLNPTDYSPIK